MKYIFGFLVFWVIFAFSTADAQMPTTDYELVAAGQTAQVCGATGAAGDILEKVIIVPETTAAGTVAIKDGSDSAINIFVTGTLADLSTITVPINARSRAGAWQISTGTNVHAICIGRFK